MTAHRQDWESCGSLGQDYVYLVSVAFPGTHPLRHSGKLHWGEAHVLHLLSGDETKGKAQNRNLLQYLDPVHLGWNAEVTVKTAEHSPLRFHLAKHRPCSLPAWCAPMVVRYVKMGNFGRIRYWQFPCDLQLLFNVCQRTKRRGMDLPVSNRCSCIYFFVSSEYLPCLLWLGCKKVNLLLLCYKAKPTTS